MTSTENGTRIAGVVAHWFIHYAIATSMLHLEDTAKKMKLSIKDFVS